MSSRSGRRRQKRLRLTPGFLESRCQRFGESTSRQLRCCGGADNDKAIKTKGYSQRNEGLEELLLSPQQEPLNIPIPVPASSVLIANLHRIAHNWQCQLRSASQREHGTPTQLRKSLTHTFAYFSGQVQTSRSEHRQTQLNVAKGCGHNVQKLLLC